MNDTAAIITAITAAVSVMVTVYTAANSASRAELIDLRTQVTKLRKENNQLWNYVGLLAGMLRENNIEVPPMPDMDGEE